MPDEQPIYSPDEEKLIAAVKRSRMWKLIRDALVYERERLYCALPDADALGADRRLWMRQGEMAVVQRLLHQAPHLVVIYDRYRRDQEAKGETVVKASEADRPGDAPNLGDE